MVVLYLSGGYFMSSGCSQPPWVHPCVEDPKGPDARIILSPVLELQ